MSCYQHAELGTPCDCIAHARAEGYATGAARYKRIAFAFRKRIRQIRGERDALWDGELDCSKCQRITNNGLCYECMRGQIPDTPSHAKAYAAGLEAAARKVCTYAGRCNSGRCPCHAIRALAAKEVDRG